MTFEKVLHDAKAKVAALGFVIDARYPNVIRSKRGEVIASLPDVDEGMSEAMLESNLARWLVYIEMMAENAS